MAQVFGEPTQHQPSTLSPAPGLIKLLKMAVDCVHCLAWLCYHGAQMKCLSVRPEGLRP